jgi:hypothetical protein
MDKERDHIDNKIASAFNSQERKAPTGLWSSISASVELSADETAIKQSFQNVQTKEAPKKGWTNVKKQLIIDDVWNNILAFQERRRRRAIIWWWSGSLGFLLLLFGLTRNYLGDQESHLKEDKINVVASSSDESESNSDDNSESSIQTDSKRSNIGDESFGSEPNNSVITASESEVNNLNPGNFDTNGESIDSEISAESTSVGDSRPDNSDRTLPSRDLLASFESVDQLAVLPAHYVETNANRELAELTVLDLTPFKRFEIGLNLSGGNTWLFNNDVKSGFNSNSLIHNKLSTGYSFGVEGFYNFNSRHSVFAGYDVYSVHQQNYSYYQSGRLIDKNITLKQQKAILGYKFSFMDRAYNKRNFVIRAGGFFAHSIEEQTEVNYVNNTPNSSFETIDYGLNIGGGIEHKFNRFKLEYGVRSDIGVNNMTASSVNLPKKFDYATSFMIGGYVSIRYKF